MQALSEPLLWQRLEGVWPQCLFWSAVDPDVQHLACLTDADWSSLLTAAGKHQLTPLLYRRLCILPSVSVPPAILERLRQVFIRSAIATINRERWLRKLLSALNDADIAPTPFKGVALAYGAYPEPACRPMGDIDLWVSAEEMPRAQVVLESLGYRSRDRVERPLALQESYDGEIKMFGQQPGQGLVELHWGIFAGEWLRRTTRIDRIGVRSRLRPGYLLEHRVLQLSPEDAFIQLAVHLSINHQMSLQPLRNLVDMILVAEQGLDWDVVVERARAWRLAAAVGLVLELLTTLFPVPAAKPAAAALRLSLARRWLVGRFTSPVQVLAGENITRSRRRLLFQLALVDRPADVAALLARSVWPERQWLAARYGQAGLGVRLRHAGAVLRGKV